MNSNDEKLSRRIEKMTPLDDIMMSRIFDDNVPLIQYVIRTILHRDDIDIVSVRTQYELHNPVLNGKDIRLDILAVDSKGNQYNIEMQKYKSGASIRRAEIHAGALSLRGYSKGMSFDEIKDTYVIFIMDKDYLGGGLQIYYIANSVYNNNTRGVGGVHIIFLNTSYVTKDELGLLEIDLNTSNPEDMHSELFKDSAERFKKEGKMNMSVREEVIEIFKDEIEESKAKARAEARAEALAEGEASGITKGRAEGEAKTKEMVRANLEKLGYSKEEIAKILSATD